MEEAKELAAYGGGSVGRMTLKQVKTMQEAECSDWRRRILHGHVPFRRDCCECLRA